MADSLRDQLLALGLAKAAPKPEAGPKPRADGQRRGGNERASNPARGGVRPGGGATRPGGGPPKPGRAPRTQEEIDLARAYAVRARAEREERQRAEAEAARLAKEKREKREKLIALLKDQSLNAADADVARHFPHGAKIRRVYVTAEQLPMLNRGELGVVQLKGRYHVVTREVALAAQAIEPESLVLLPDPDAATPEDDIPADLIW